MYNGCAAVHCVVPGSRPRTPLGAVSRSFLRTGIRRRVLSLRGLTRQGGEDSRKYLSRRLKRFGGPAASAPANYPKAATEVNHRSAWSVSTACIAVPPHPSAEVGFRRQARST